MHIPRGAKLEVSVCVSEIRSEVERRLWRRKHLAHFSNCPLSSTAPLFATGMKALWNCARTLLALWLIGIGVVREATGASSFLRISHIQRASSLDGMEERVGVRGSAAMEHYEYGKHV